MKRFRMISAPALALVLAAALGACAQSGPSAPATSGSVPEKASSAPAQQASSAQREAPAPQADSAFDKAAFKDFLEYAGFGTFWGDAISGPEQVKTFEVFGVAGPVTWIAAHHCEETGQAMPPVKGHEEEPGAGYLKISDLEGVSQDLYGFVYDFEAEQFPGDPDGYFRRVWGFGPTFHGAVDESTITYDGGTAEAVLDYQGQHGDKWKLKYTFAYHPENRFCPYRFVRSEETERTPVVAPTAMIDAEEARVAAADLPLRMGPGPAYDVIATVPKGEKVYAEGYLADAPDEWLYVSYGLALGWVEQDHLEKTTPG